MTLPPIREYGHAVYIYWLGPALPTVKIGHTNNPERRLEEFRRETGTPGHKANFAAIVWLDRRREDVERRAHQIAAEYRRDGEWFAMSAEEALKTITRAADELAIRYEVEDRADISPETLANKTIDNAKIYAIDNGHRIINDAIDCKIARPDSDENFLIYIACQQLKKEVFDNFNLMNEDWSIQRRIYQELDYIGGDIEDQPLIAFGATAFFWLMQKSYLKAEVSVAIQEASAYAICHGDRLWKTYADKAVEHLRLEALPNLFDHFDGEVLLAINTEFSSPKGEGGLLPRDIYTASIGHDGFLILIKGAFDLAENQRARQREAVEEEYLRKRQAEQAELARMRQLYEQEKTVAKDAVGTEILKGVGCFLGLLICISIANSSSFLALFGFLGGVSLFSCMAKCFWDAAKAKIYSRKFPTFEQWMHLPRMS